VKGFGDRAVGFRGVVAALVLCGEAEVVILHKCGRNCVSTQLCVNTGVEKAFWNQGLRLNP
jgi:hypothetical protein